VKVATLRTITLELSEKPMGKGARKDSLDHHSLGGLCGQNLKFVVKKAPPRRIGEKRGPIKIDNGRKSCSGRTILLRKVLRGSNPVKASMI